MSRHERPAGLDQQHAGAAAAGATAATTTTTATTTATAGIAVGVAVAAPSDGAQSGVVAPPLVAGVALLGPHLLRIRRFRLRT